MYGMYKLSVVRRTYVAIGSFLVETVGNANEIDQ
jgi:hypothetical protein